LTWPFLTQNITESITTWKSTVKGCLLQGSLVVVEVYIQAEANRLTVIDVATKDKARELYHERKQLEKNKFALVKDLERLSTEMRILKLKS